MASVKPLASIIIPVVNNLGYNKQCLESIFSHTPAPPLYEIIVVDNNSTDGSREYFRSLGNKIKLIGNDTLRTFAQSCNQGAENAEGEFLVFLNNDTYVTPGWLEAMLDCIRSDPKIGIVGNKQLFPGNNLVYHAGGVFNEEKIPKHLYLHFDPRLEFLNVDREYQWVTACCLLTTQRLFSALGGFDEGYKNSYEDVDLCLKARARGCKVVYCHESVIYHYGQSTPGRMDRELQNRKRFHDRWWDRIEPDKDSFIQSDNVPACFKTENFVECDLDRFGFLGGKRATHKERLEAIYNSWIWRATKPWRRIKRHFRKKASRNARGVS
ncbi:MAG: glycosyltransferase family 2 protein [Nitrospinales bacterium]